MASFTTQLWEKSQEFCMYMASFTTQLWEKRQEFCMYMASFTTQLWEKSQEFCMYMASFTTQLWEKSQEFCMCHGKLHHTAVREETRVLYVPWQASPHSCERRDKSSVCAMASFTTQLWEKRQEFCMYMASFTTQLWEKRQEFCMCHGKLHQTAVGEETRVQYVPWQASPHSCERRHKSSVCAMASFTKQLWEKRQEFSMCHGKLHHTAVRKDTRVLYVPWQASPNSCGRRDKSSVCAMASFTTQLWEKRQEFSMCHGKLHHTAVGEETRVQYVPWQASPNSCKRRDKSSVCAMASFTTQLWEKRQEFCMYMASFTAQLWEKREFCIVLYGPWQASPHSCERRVKSSVCAMASFTTQLWEKRQEFCMYMASFTAQLWEKRE